MRDDVIYCCYHKLMPLLRSDIVQPIHVGRACSSLRLPMMGDDTGDSISERNPYWCELTALYWMWKNEGDEVVGLTHYRRLFNLKDDRTRAWIGKDADVSRFGLTQSRVDELLADADIILPKKMTLVDGSETAVCTVYEHYKKYHHIEDLELTIRIVLEKHPEAEEVLKHVIDTETQGYWTNLFITSRPLFESYAAWLFDILFEVEHHLQPQLASRDNYQKRVYGFLSERLFNVWLALHPEIRICEMPTLFLESSLLSYGAYLLKRS